MKIENGKLINIDIDNDIDADGKCVIPYGVSFIGEEAFYNSNVKSVIIPNSVTTINSFAFYECQQLNKITIPYSVSEIECDAFYGCDSLKAVYISDLTNWCNINFSDSYRNPLYYAHDLYLNRELVKKLIIPDGITTIKDSSFEGGSFEEIIIPNSVTCIENYAFFECESLKTIIIPNSVKSLGEGAFNWCKSLSKIVVKGEVVNVDGSVFAFCDNLKEIYVSSEHTKQNFLKNNCVPKNCKIIVDESLNEN